MQKNSEYILETEDLNAQGQGVAHVEGLALFLPGALPGEKVRARVIKVTSHYAIGRVMERYSASPERTEAVCPHFPRCGGCSWQHMTYALQCRQKQENILQCFRKQGMQPPFEGLIAMESPWGFRNKGQFPAAPGSDGCRIGMYAARSHTLVDVEACPIEEDAVNEVLACVREWVRLFGITGYDETNGRGLLRHVCARHVSDQTMAVLVVTDFSVPHAQELVEMLRQAVPDLTGVLLNLNRRRDNRIYGEDMKCLWGKDTLTADLNGVKLEISALSFFQVNTRGMIALYDTVAEFAELSGNEIVYDAYCGAGSIGLYAARNAAAVYGVEEVALAVENAIRNAALNHNDHAFYTCGKAEEVFPQWIEKGIRPDVLIVDPPFKGCHEDFLAAAAKASPSKIIYVSCNPATLARDAAYLARTGYAITRMRAVDLFPQGEHVETVCLLSREEVGGYVENEVK